MFLGFGPQSMWDLNSQPRIRTLTPALEGKVLTSLNQEVPALFLVLTSIPEVLENSLVKDNQG